jgi:hypothetical protein
MSLFTGDDGKVQVGGATLADITAWTFQTSAHHHSYASNATAGFRHTICGARHGQGRFAFRLDPASPLTNQFDEGSLVTLKLYLDATRLFTVPAVIESIEMQVDIDGGQVVAGTAQFRTHGAWTKPAY